MNRWILGILLSLTFLQPLRGADAGTSALEAIQERGTLTMLSFPHTRSVFVRPNLEYGPTQRLGPAEHFVGIDVEILQAFAAHLGVDLEIRTLETPGYGPLIPALLDGQADLLASSLTITEARREIVDFSDPYFTLYPVIITQKNSPIHSVADLDGRTAATIAGSSHSERLAALGIPEARMLYVDFTSAYYTAILEEGAEFAVVDSITAARDLAEFPDLEIAFRLPEEEHYGMALPPGSDLLPVLNRFLAGLKKSGELQRLIDRNLEELPADAMETVTVK